MVQDKRRSQAVTELAIFGAILIFVIGSTLRNAVDSGMNQSQSLKAMRWAMLQSLQGVRNTNKSRDSASIIFVEDRLSPDAGKVGSMERTPLIQTGSGSFSNTLFMPLDWLEYHNIPITDVFVNGVHFTLSTARFIVYDIRLDPGNPSRIRVWDLTNNIQTFFPKRGNWEDNCTVVGGVNVGCPIFSTVVPSNSAKFCPVTCSDATITLDQRFDLNHNDDYTDDVTGVTRSRMGWQWGAVRALVGNIKIDHESGSFPPWDVDADRREETVYEVNPDSLWQKTGVTYAVQQGTEPLVNPAVDMAALEAASGITYVDIVDPDGNVTGQQIQARDVVQQVYVLDFQKGDLNAGLDDLDYIAMSQTALDRGLLRSASLYTQVKDGTYLEINEGKAFVPNFGGTGEFVRSVSRKDSVDVISRIFQMDNSTGRYCGTRSGTRWPTIGNSGGLPNPVQYCVDSVRFPATNCFTPVTTGATCFDMGTKRLYIRSRIEDTSGRKWVTQTK